MDARPPRRLGLRLAVAALLALAAAAVVLDRLYPLPAAWPGGTLVVADHEGAPLRTYPSRDGIWRYPVGIDQVSPRYVASLLAYEDRWFRWHPGVNPFSLARAGWQWLRQGRIVSGGSTLSMQVARLIDPALAGGDSRRLSAKLRQILRALQLEWHLDKDEILGLYMSRAPMGGIVEGVEMGARMWLGKPALHLTDAEAALLAALPQAPSRLRPDRHPQAARAARDKVLARIALRQDWPQARFDDALIENVVAPPLRARWLAPLAAQRLAAEAGREAPVLVSNLDADMQALVERMLLDRVAALPPRVSMAVLVMDNDSLAVRAYAGSADFGDATRYAHVDMVRGVRSPGSTLKPFLYAMALDDGLVHSESLLRDEPLSFGGYAPGNFQAAFSGPVSVSQALQRSLNVPAVDLLDRVGPPRFAAAMAGGGVHLRMPGGAAPNLSLILGGGGTTLEELVGAYRALARDGVAGRPRLLPAQPVVESRIMSAGAAWIVRDILEGGGHPDRPFAGLQRLAWKTGTSFGFRDAWALGVTDAWTLGVWVGRPDGTPNPGFFGANVAAPLLRDIATALPARPARGRHKPAGVTAASTCWPFGVRAESGATQSCSQLRTAWILDDTVPPTFPSYADRSEGTLRLTGVSDGTVLRPVPGEPEVRIELGAAGAGATGELWWMLDGRVVGSGQAQTALTLVLQDNGAHVATVMDARGRHDSARFQITGVAP